MSVFNNKYEISKKIGEGFSSHVYLCRDLEDSGKFTALKIIKSKFLKQDSNAIEKVKKEYEIQKQLNHSNINKAVDFGTEGTFTKINGSKVENLTYLMLDYVSGRTLIDLIH